MRTATVWKRVSVSGVVIAAPVWLTWLSISGGCASLQDELGAKPEGAMASAPPSMPMPQARPPMGQPAPPHQPPTAYTGGATGMAEPAPGAGVVSAPRLAPAASPNGASPPSSSSPPPLVSSYPVAPAVQERPSSGSYNDPARGYGVPAATVPATDPGLLPVPAYQPSAAPGGNGSAAGGPSWPNDGSNQLYRMNPAAASGVQPAMGGGPTWPNDGSNQVNRLGAGAAAPVMGNPAPTGVGATWPNDGTNQLGRTGQPAQVQAAMQAAAPHLPVSVVGQVPPAAAQKAAPLPASADPHSVGSSALAGHGSAAAHWTYEGSTGPQAWGDLQPDYKLCKLGRNQSPVDIPAGLNVEPYPLTFQYRPVPLSVLNNGHTLQLANPTDARLVVNGEEFQLAQLHFHAPSEHTVQGRSYPLEMHLVHKNSAGVLAVVGVLFEEGPENPILERIWQVAPRGAGQTQDVPGVAIDLDSMLSLDKGFVRYSGSLTTPPCTEGVRWFVLNQPNYLSSQQVRAFEAINGPNARPVQYLMGRKVVRNQ